MAVPSGHPTPIVLSAGADDNSAPQTVASERSMSASTKSFGLDSVLMPADSREPSLPIWLARDANWVRSSSLTAAQKAWLGVQGMRASGGARHLLVPAADGTLAGAVL